MKKNYTTLFLIIAILLFFGTCSVEEKGDTEKVDVIKPAYYFISLDKTGKTDYDFGIEYANKILELQPNFEYIVDTYLYDLDYMNDDYNLFLERADTLKSKLNSEYFNEIEGMASVLCSADVNDAGDKKLSKNELYLVNLLPDVARTTQCSVVSVFDSLSSTGSSFVGRNLDWFAGFHNQLNRLHAVVTITNGSKSISLIGYLGFLGAITGVNDNNIFACILDSETSEDYVMDSSMYSYPHKLRYALENYTTLDDIANYMVNTSRNYPYGHLIFVSDSQSAKIVENDVRSDATRRIRDTSSTIRSTVTAWPSKFASGSIGAVNSFILDGNRDNHTYDDYNSKRWDLMVNQLNNISTSTISPDNIKNIMTHYTGDVPRTMEDGDLCNNITQQIMIYHPATNELEIHFNMSDNLFFPDKNTDFKNYTITF